MACAPRIRNGVCNRKKKFFGLVTITERGQIAIPVELRRDLGVKNGNQMIIIRRDDGNGFNLLKPDIIDDFLNKLAKD